MTSDRAASKTNQHDVSRRGFVKTAAATTALAAAHVSAVSAAGLNRRQDKVVIGIMGLSRGMALARTFLATPGVEIKYLCETDSNRLAAAVKALETLVDNPVVATGNFRDILDDPDVDVLVCAAPNHWHAPAAILACQAGKHCYVEKPCSHNPWEGEMVVAAARKFKKCVQMGSQRRSADKIIEAIGMIHEGRIGNVFYSRSWYANLRGPIGESTPAPVPPHIDYELWQGPAPRQPFTSNRLPYNWHWVWHYGNGELGNNGIHSLDLSRWGLDVDYPTRVVSSGGRYFFDDAQETADTHVVSFEFEGKKQMVWEGLSCNRMGPDGTGFGVSFHGDNGSIKLDSWGYSVFDQKGKELEKVEGVRADAAHIANFIDAIRADDPTMLNAEIEIGHKSTLLCHLGNIAHRTGASLKCDPSNGHIIGNPAAEKLWKREYEPGWEPNIS